MPAEIQGQFGGRVTFQFGSLVIPPSDGEFVIDPSLYEVTAKTNQDGSAAYELKPKQPGAEIKLRNVGDVDWNAILLQTGNCTIVEQTNGRTHLFTNTRLVGTAKVNISTGEVDGLRVEGGTYQFRASS
jgi:hypothetical protein